MWSGDPDYLRLLPIEEIVDEKIEQSGSEFDVRIVRRVTLKAKDSSYYRSYISIKSQVGSGSDLHHVFGIKYLDNQTHQRYRDQYLDFQESLRQYAD